MVGAAPSRDAESRGRGKASHSAQGAADGEVSADQVQGHGTVRVVADTGLVGGGESRGMLGREQAQDLEDLVEHLGLGVQRSRE